MKMTCLASSSNGNCYIIEMANTKLLIEAGLTYGTIRQKLLEHGLTIKDLDGCIISHEHQDHARGAKDLAKHIKTFVPRTIAKTPVMHEIKDFEQIIINDISVTAFTVEHDVLNYGFIIRSDKEALLYINDAKFVEWDLSAIPFTHIMIEANYNDEILNINDPKNQRTINTHMALSTTITTLKALNLTQCQSIYLMHLSDLNSNEEWMLRKIMSDIGIKSFVCNKFGGTKGM